VVWLEQIIPEKNSIIEFWETLKIKPKNAAQSQALLQLKMNIAPIKNV